MINGKQSRFNQLLHSIEESIPNTLSARLGEMEKDGLIKCKVYPYEKPVRIGYYLTIKGLALRHFFDDIAADSMKHCTKDVFIDAKPRQFEQGYC